MTLLLTIKEAAEETRLSEWFIKKAIRERDLIARKYGRATRIERSELEKWIKCRNLAGDAPVGGGESWESAENQVVESKVSIR